MSKELDKGVPGNGHAPQKRSGGIPTPLLIAIVAVAIVFALLFTLPVLIFLLKVGWPHIKAYFHPGLEDLKAAADQVQQATWYLGMWLRSLLG